MSSKDRQRRPDLGRNEARRNFGTLFSPPTADATNGGSNGSGAPSMSDVVSHSVDLGYRIIDDYMREGEKAARRLSERSATPQTVINDARDVTTRFAQHAAGLAAVWIEMLQATAANAGAPFAANVWEAFTPPAAKPTPARSASVERPSATPAADSDGARVRLEVNAAQPITVALELHPGAGRRALNVLTLRGQDEAHTITGVTFAPERDDAPSCLHIRVPARQAEGTYYTLLIDSVSNLPVGNLTVTVGEDRDRDRDRER